MATLAYGLEIGASIGGYRIDGVIGRGGMGVVYAATHERLKRKAALKILSPELADDESFRERFIRESQLATGAIGLADRAEEAYARLGGAAATLPEMPLRRVDHLHLAALVPKPVPQPKPFTPPASQPSPSPQPAPAPAVDDRAAVAAVIHGHWQAIDNGDYGRAYDYFSRRLQSQQARSNWIRDKQTDRPRSSPISISSISISGDVAYASVSFATIGQERSAGNTGCNRWSGSYRLVKSGSSWFLDKSTLQRTSVDCAVLQGD
jgi:hypothetical protein